MRRSADFEAVFREGRRSADSFFTVLYRSSNSQQARLGVAIAARRVRTAVARNRLRRLIRESFRMARHSLAGLDIVVLARSEAAAADNPEIFASLARHWQQLQRRRPRTAARTESADG